MFSGPPLPLSPDLPLRHLVQLANNPEGLGVWVRGCTRKVRLRVRSPGRCFRVMVSGDLGQLLGCCREVALRMGSQPVVAGVEVLIQWRALQVVTSTPYLPSLERLDEVFPGAHLNSGGFAVPIPNRHPEEVLADCLVQGISVEGSRIVYCAPLPPSPGSEG